MNASPSKPRGSYHHGNLREALLEAAEELLREEGPQGLKLRAIARRAGVSHTAANPHFGGLCGLVSELAAVGFRRLHLSLQTAETRARGYVNFALEQPHLFSLMFRTNLPDFEHPALREAADITARDLRRANTDCGEDQSLGFDDAVRMTVAWSAVHGLSSLIIDGRLDGIVAQTQPSPGLAELIDAVLAAFATRPGGP